MPAPRILVTGSNGQLGSELKALAASFSQYSFVFLTRQELPLNDIDAARKLFSDHPPHFLINCAAYTAVDKAESEKEEASIINGTAVGELAKLCRQHGTKFIHISTDYVFDGNATAPLKETENTSPVNAYGASKLLGEQLAVQNEPASIIIRTSWVYSSHGGNFVKTMLRLMKERGSIGVVDDQVGSPTYAADLAEIILQIIASGKWVPGIYHFSNEGVISWYEFAKEIKTLSGSSCIINPITTAQFPTPAKRPRYSVLDKTKIVATFGLQLKDWRTSLQACLRQLGAIS